MKNYIVIGFLLLLFNPLLAKMNFDDIHGKWRLMYKRNSGYEFRFHNNYRAYCILYYGSNALVFKGIYTIENNLIRININEVKNSRKVRRIDMQRKFIKTSSSYFIFNAYLIKSGKKSELILKPVMTIIDGNDSNGYFEPEIKLTKS